MTRVLKIVLLWLIVGAMVWLFTLWHWQQSGRDVDLFDIVSYLLVLPTVIAGGWLLALWVIKKIRAKAAQEIVLPAAQTSHAAPALSGDQALQRAHALVLDAAVHTCVGPDAMSSLAEVQSGAVRPGLDPSLQDYDGLPIFSARVADLDLDDADIGELPRADAPAMAVSRAMALLRGPVEQLAETWMSLLEQLSPTQAMAAGGTDHEWGSGAKTYLSGVGHRTPDDEKQRTDPIQWTVRILMPASWSVADQDLVVCAVRSRLAAVVDHATACGMAAPQWQVIPPATPEIWWSELDAHIKRWGREGRAEALLILAVDSALDEPTVERWQSVGELFTAQHQTGRVPGEAAVGMLLSSPALRGRVDFKALAQPAIRLARPVCLRRDKSADALGRVGATTLVETMTQALAVAGVAPSLDLMVVTDADHRASRTSELFEALQTLVPGIDPTVQVTRAGEVLGDVGVARSLLSAALGCAAVWASEGEQVALATHVQSSHERVALALSVDDAQDAVPV
ncbi:MAG: hypothetical protein RLZZ369_169 [Pseudomonadota bacterium]